MKRPTMLVQAILHQAAIDLDLSVERDLQTLASRCKHEGLSFLTLVLPKLSDSLEKGLECGLFSCPTNFSRHGRLPKFLSGFFKRVFTLDGVLLDDACPYSIGYIRQICRFFKKPKMECPSRVNEEAIQHFVDVEDELRMATPNIVRQDYILDQVSRVLWSQVFPEIDPLDLVCHHGPGATAEKKKLNERNLISLWNSRSEFSFPSDLHCFPNYGLAAEFSGYKETDGYSPVQFLSIRDELPVRVVLVPKTQTSPRVIAIEPSHVQYMQQSVKDYAYRVLEEHALTRDSIRFTRQGPNQELARISSMNKRLATLDLKDASDRVHLHLVQRIFKNSGILAYLEDSRSLSADLPDGRNIVLSKFASMGSALCFPVEAMVFYTLIQAAMHRHAGIHPTSASIKKFSSSIDVYGDDIIVPVHLTDVVVDYLESYSLKVNVNKSFSKGYFRESCGADYYKGIPVDPVYARKIPHDDPRDWEADHLLSWNATADLFYIRGQWHVAQVIRDMLQRVARVAIPRSRQFGSGLVHFSYLFSTGLRYCDELHGWKQKRTTFQPLKQKDEIDGNELACLNAWGLHTVRSAPGEFILGQHTPGHRHGNAGVLEVREIRNVSWGYHSNCFVGLKEVEHRNMFSIPRLRGLSQSYEWTKTNFSSLPSLASVSLAFRKDVEHVRTRTESDVRSSGRDPTDNYLKEVSSDPYKALYGLSEGLDFSSSTRTGVLKSKRRWVSIAC